MAELTALPPTEPRNGINEQTAANATKEACARVSTLSSDDSGAHQRRSAHSWQPSIFRIRPWIGLFALGVSVACMLASLGILIGSRGQPIDGWYFQPTVYLAIATAVSNTALNVALAQAAPIRWWWKAYQGSTIQDLELEWEAGQSFPRALMRGFRRGRHLNLLTIASIIVALVVVDGPVLQRSSSVESSKIKHSIVQNISIAPELPTGFSGTLYPSGGQQLAPPIYAIVRHYGAGDSVTSTASCDGSCAMKVHAPGVSSRDCTTKRWDLNQSTLVNPNSSWGSQYMGAMPSRPALFSNVFAYSPGTPLFESAGHEELILIVGRLDVKSPNGGVYIETNCTLRSAILEYDVVMQGHDVTFTTRPGSGEFIKFTENTFVDLSLNHTQPLTWLGIMTYLQVYISTNVTGGIESEPYPFPDSKTMNELAFKHAGFANSNGTVMMGDPTTEILNIINEVMFRAGVVAGWDNLTHGLDDGLTASQSVKANQTLVVNVYTSDIRWFAGAAAIQVVALLLILPVFYGWWMIGVRDFVLSPFHLANIFDAPILRNVNSSAGVMEILRETGDVHVRLGDVEPLLVRPATGVKDPVTTQPRYKKSRLGVAESYRVGKPFRGMEFGE